MQALTSAVLFVDSETGRSYTVHLIPENQLTDDPSRRFPVGPIGWRDGRIPFTFSDREGDPHMEAVHVGNLFNLRRESIDGTMWVVADLDWDTDELAVEAKRLVDEDRITGVSISPSDLEAFLICGTPDNPTAESVRALAELFNPESCPEENWTEAWINIVIGSATLLMGPAFEDAEVIAAGVPVASEGLETEPFNVLTATTMTVTQPNINYVSTSPMVTLSTLAVEVQEAFKEGVQAAADLKRPPADWFTDPTLDGPTALTIDDDGKVAGHLALWSTCHRGFGNDCVTPPQDATDYAEFHDNARVMLDTGELLGVGCLTVDVSHADMRASAEEAKRHYDHSGTTVAQVRAGQDEHGVWLAGAVVPWATPAQIEKLRRLSLSGDWRPKGGSYFLIAAQAVPVPGFPIRAKVASGIQVSLTTIGPANEPEPVVASLKALDVADLFAAGLEMTNKKLDAILDKLGEPERLRAYEEAVSLFVEVPAI